MELRLNEAATQRSAFVEQALRSAEPARGMQASGGRTLWSYGLLLDQLFLLRWSLMQELHAFWHSRTSASNCRLHADLPH